MSFLLRSESGLEIIIDKVSDNVDDWVIIKDEKYRPNRDKFVVDRFELDFSNISLAALPSINKKAERIYNLVSRSLRLTEWLARVNLEYALLENTPTFYRDLVSPEEFQISSDSLLRLSQKAAEQSAEELEAARSYKTKIAEIRNRYSAISNSLKTTRLVKILSLKSNSMPLTLQMAIENYTPADQSPDKKTYARELLIKYKLSLIKVSRNLNCEELDNLITEMETK